MSRVLGSTIETIRRFISDELEPNEQLPNEQELVRMTGVSRGTVRAAIARLETDGLVNKRWGVGTFVAESAPQTGFGFLSVRTGIPGLLETTGGQATVHRFEVDEEAPEPALFPDFPDAPVAASTRVFSLDHEPVVLIRDRLVAEYNGRRLDLAPLVSIAGLVPDAMRRMGLELTRLELDITAALLDTTSQALFDLDDSEPVLHTMGDGFDPDGRRILVTHVIFRTRLMGLRVTAT